MKVTSKFLNLLHLDRTYSLLSAKNARLVYEYFSELDVHEVNNLNDLQFVQFMKHITTLSVKQIYKVFDMLDTNGSGQIDFDEFYLLVCILIAMKDNDEREFIYRHSRTVFDLLDIDNSGNISAVEFTNFGFLFHFEGKAVRKIFKEFDVSGDQELDYREFRMFAMACIDKQNEIHDKNKLKQFKKKKRKEAKKKKEELEKMKQKKGAGKESLSLDSNLEAAEIMDEENYNYEDYDDPEEDGDDLGFSMLFSEAGTK